MTPEMEALGRRAVACKGWRWMPGMKLLCPERGCDRVVRVEDRLYVEHGSWTLPAPSDILPDFRDAPTRGALLELVREAWKDPEACTATWMCEDDCPTCNGTGSSGVGECVLCGGDEVIETRAWAIQPSLEPQDAPDLYGRGTSEIEALVAALEAAP